MLNAWELAITKTGGYLYSRALLALLSAFFHWVVFQSIGTQAPIALALWVGLVSQFLPVVGTYLAGILPVLVTFLDSPLKAVIVIGFIVIYQQIENYFFAPRITARTMELHPAVAFGAALGGASLLGAIGAILALPAAAMAQALASEWGDRYDVIDSHLTVIQPPRRSSASRRPAQRTNPTRRRVPPDAATQTRFDGSVRTDRGRDVAAGSTSRCTTARAWRSQPTASVDGVDRRSGLVVYPRSSLKPLQAYAMLGLGLELPPDLARVGVCQPQR